MNEEYIYVKTDAVQKDMRDFVNQFGDEISSLSYVGNTIKLKNGVVYRFTYNTIGIRKYYTYIEIYIYHLELKSKKLKQENQQLKERLQEKENIINKAKKYNKQIIKDTKYFFRPTAETIYSGDCLIELANKNIEILNNKGE